MHAYLCKSGLLQMYGPFTSDGRRGMRRTTVVIVGVLGVLWLCGCGGGGSADSQKAPNNEELGNVSVAYSTIATGCLSPSPDESAMTRSVDTLIEQYKKSGTAP